MQTKEVMYAMAFALTGMTVTAVPAHAQSVQRTNALKSASIRPTNIVQFEVVGEATGTRILLVGEQPFEPDIRTFAQPTATVITIPGRWKAGQGRATEIRRNGVTTVRYGQFSDRPEQVRIVANTQGILPFRTQSSPDRTRWEIMIDTPNAQKMAARNNAAAAKPQSGTNTAPETLGEPKPVSPAALVARGISGSLTPPAPGQSRAVITAVGGNRTNKPMLVALGSGRIVTQNGPYNGLVSALQAAKKPAPVLTRQEAAAPTPANEETATTAVASASLRFGGTDRSVDEERRVTVDFVNTDITDVLKALALQSGVNIVTSTDVKGTVTVSLRRVSFREALDTVVNLSGYKYARIGSTYAVGSGDGVAALVRGSAIGNQMNAIIPFIFSDGSSLRDAIETAFPSVKGRVSVVAIGSEGKTATSDAIRNDQTTGQTSTAAASTTNSSSNTNTSRVERIIEKVIPKGGVISVTGTETEVTTVRAFIEETERGLLEAPKKEALAKAQEAAVISALQTEVYYIKYGSPRDLIQILNQLVPIVSVQSGPSQGFQPQVLGSSASFSTGGTVSGGGFLGGGSVNQSSQPPAGAGGATSNTGTQTQGLTRQSNTLLLTGAPTSIARARQILEQIDIKVPQILFEAKVVDTNAEDLKELGLTYDLTRPVQVGESNITNNNIGVPTPPGNPGRDPRFGTIFRTPYTITAQLAALQDKNRARVLASPNLSALDGQSAVSFIGDQLKYVVAISQTPQGQVVQTETATVGITLRVSGKTSPDGNVTVYVHPEVSIITGFLNAGNGITLPQVATRFVDTIVRVKDGETFALGGLIRKEDVDNIRKVPILGDLPFFGNLLFTSRDRQRRNSEVVILITTRVLKD